MSIDVNKIAHLARLKITSEDTSNLDNILEMMTRIQSIDTSGITPIAHPLEGYQRLRPDQITEPNNRDAFQEIAPQVIMGLYLVPQVIE